MPDAPPELPDDVKALIAKLRRTHTIEIMGGGELRVGDAIEKLDEKTGARADLDVHIRRWERFRMRWSTNPRFAALAGDIKQWEARKAAMDDTPARASWFAKQSAAARLELVKQRQEWLASERRFRLKNRQWKDFANV